MRGYRNGETTTDFCGLTKGRMNMGQRTTALHSYAHVSEACYAAVRHALFPAGYPMKRGPDGRFVSRIADTTERLRSELAAENNTDLAEAIERTRAA